MAELLITSSIDPIAEGQVFEYGLPRHVTIWQDFTLPDLHMDGFIQDVGYATQAFAPFEVFGADQSDAFGPNQDVSVRRVIALGRGSTLITYHTVLGTLIDKHEGEVRNPEWAYEGYVPHVTYVNGRALEEAEHAKLSTVELIMRDPHNTSTKIVRKLWDLEDVES